MADLGPRRSPAKRRAILDAAIKVFTDQGYARASVDAIAAAAGVGKQTVYGHFGDKEQLFLAAVQEARTVVGAAPAHEPDRPAAQGVAGRPIVFSGDPHDDLTALGEQILDIALSPRVSALHRLTIAEVAHHPELQRTWRASSASADGALVGYLRGCDADGRLRVPDPAKAARQLSHLVITEGRVETAYGMLPLRPERRHAIAADAADLVVRAHRP
ncbi:TetR/AcrR family transcriptional regulator [Nonomuraea sp. NPDC005650]|uniref:TetR/AcrR family transcriptional regulator n=1 Tax=Nonomuraea sp. NPDC005650 TaxID=3157045 RepID=UPI0033BDF213